jgi:hypothetical protein
VCVEARAKKKGKPFFVSGRRRTPVVCCISSILTYRCNFVFFFYTIFFFCSLMQAFFLSCKKKKQNCNDKLILTIYNILQACVSSLKRKKVFLFFLPELRHTHTHLTDISRKYSFNIRNFFLIHPFSLPTCNGDADACNELYN